ncbi:hypothetical protein PVK06_049157 [Gossypium arboreum]|uniref:Uncharacterized protein n=1 Tax=Gossypium arboreum TaxID=29729 RepID=A0ABR0MHY8_GOSAR|nr:hypothetical protein PVK06_049157 [Gossypium arboreum]
MSLLSSRLGLRTKSPNRSVTLPLLNHRRPTAAGHRDTTGTAASGDTSATILWHPELVRLLLVRFGSMTT